MKQLIRHILKEENLKSELKQMVKSDGWESTYPLIGGPETLAELAYDNDPMEFIDSLGLKKLEKVDFGWVSFKNHDDDVFLTVYPGLNISEVKNEISEFLIYGFKLNRHEVMKVIKEWLFDRHGLDITRIYL